MTRIDPTVTTNHASAVLLGHTSVLTYLEVCLENVLCVDPRKPGNEAVHTNHYESSHTEVHFTGRLPLVRLNPSVTEI